MSKAEALSPTPATPQRAEANLRALDPPPEELSLERGFWIVSDSHFLHHRITAYAERPSDWAERITLNWIDRVGEDDPVLHLGDLGLGKRSQMEEELPNLPGQKFLILGNHDRRSKGFYRSIGWEPTKPFRLRYRDHQLVFTHRPDYAGDYLAAWRVLNIHGHTHQHNVDDQRFWNVSVEQTDYAPIWIPGPELDALIDAQK